MADPSTLPPDVNKGPVILIVCGIFVGLALFMVTVRIWVRLKLTANLGRDDYCAAAAMLVMFTEMMVIIPEVVYGAGRHVQYLDHKTNVKGLHLNFVTQPLCLIALCLAKVSVGLFLLRLTISRNYIRFIWGVIIFTILSTLGNLLTVFFQCQPLSFVWDFTVEGGKCIPQPHLKFAAFFNSSVSVLTDVIFAVLPIPLLWKVQLNRKTKIAVVCILSLGLFAVAAGIVKMTFLNDYGKYGDFLFDSSNLTIWTTIEICTAIVAGCAPCLKPLFKNMLRNSTHHSSPPHERVFFRERSHDSVVPSQEDSQSLGIMKTTQLSVLISPRQGR